MKKKVIIWTAIILAVVALGYVGLFRGSPDKYTYRFDQVSNGDLLVYVTATGTISPVVSVDVGTQVSGIITKLYADFNSVVKKGQIIARLDTTFLYQSLKDAEANLERAKAQLDDSKRNLVREKELYDRGLDSQLNYDAALTANETNQAALKSAQASLDRARINLAYATIYAPIDGVVVNRAVNVGQTVAASFSSPTLFTIANDLKRMQVQATVDESDVGRVSYGQEATFTVDAYPDEEFSGSVSQIRLAPQSIQNVVNYIVVIDVNNDQLKLMPGMTATVKILVAKAENVLRVSNMALRFQPPSELVDTTGAGAMRGRFSGRRMGGDRMAMAGDSLGTENGGNGEAQGASSTADDLRQSPRGDFNRFKALRDSIQQAHGGSLSPEELRSEMRKVMPERTSRESPSTVQAVTARKAPRSTAGFGVISTFPEYQKSAYVPSHEAGRGRVWVLESNGMLKPVFVRTGLNDGRYTEITTARLKAGEQIVLGASSNSGSESDQAQNPFTGQGGNRRYGGFR